MYSCHGQGSISDVLQLLLFCINYHLFLSKAIHQGAPVTFAYVPGHLYHMLFELMKVS